MGAQIAADVGLSGADALYVALAQTFQVPLVTWDKQQIDRGGTVTEVVTPASVAQEDNHDR